MQMPGILDCFGWCTWDAFYHAVNPKGIMDGLERYVLQSYFAKIYFLYSNPEPWPKQIVIEMEYQIIFWAIENLSLFLGVVCKF